MIETISKISYIHYNPVEIISGIDLISSHLCKLVPVEGQLLLVTTAGFTKRGITEKIIKELGESRVLVYDEVVSNPELDGLDLATARFNGNKICYIIGVGGGSVIDTAKVLAMTLCSDLSRPLHQILRHKQTVNSNISLPVVAIPTTSGTGAEVTPFATIWDNSTHEKHSLIGLNIYPRHALLDPELTLSLPIRDTLYTALDAVSHALESLWNKNRTTISEAYAIQSLMLANETLPALLKDLKNIELRRKMQQSSMLAGLAISYTKTAIAHSISYPLTSHFNVPHGLACGFTLPGLIERYMLNLQDGIEKQVIMSTYTILQELKLKQEISKFIKCNESLDYINDMFHPDRANNYVDDISKEDVVTLLKQSI